MEKLFIPKEFAMSLIMKSMTADKELASLKKELIARLMKNEKKEKSELKKAIIEAEKNYSYLSKSENGYFVEKSYPVGTHRTWKGQEYVKIAPGKWKPFYREGSHGAKISVGKLAKRIENAKDINELMQLVSENMQRFGFEAGDPLYQKLKDAQKRWSDKDSGKTAAPEVKDKADTPSKTIDYYKDISDKLTKEEKRAINDEVVKYSKENEWSIPENDMKKFISDWKSALNDKDEHSKAEKLYKIYSTLEDVNYHHENKQLLAGNFDYFNDKYFADMYGENTEDSEKNEEKKNGYYSDEFKQRTAKQLSDKINSMKESGSTDREIKKFLETKIKNHEERIKENESNIEHKRVQGNQAKSAEDTIQVDKVQIENAKKELENLNKKDSEKPDEAFYESEKKEKDNEKYKKLQDEFKQEIADGKRSNTKELQEDVNEWKHMIAMEEEYRKENNGKNGGLDDAHLDHIKEVIKIGEAELKKREESEAEKHQNRSQAMMGNKNAYKGTNLEKAVEKYANDKTIKNIVSKADEMDFSSTDPSRYFMAGVYHDKGYSIATDGKMLCRIKSDYDKSDDGKLKVNKDHLKTIDKNISNLKSKLAEGEELLKKIDRGSIRYQNGVEELEEIKKEIAQKEKIKETGRMEFSGSNKYPQYERVIPSMAGRNLEKAEGFEDTNKIMKMCKTAMAYAKEIKQLPLKTPVKVGDRYYNPEQLLNVLAMAEKHGLNNVVKIEGNDNGPIEFNGDKGNVVLMPLIPEERNNYFDAETGNAVFNPEKYDDEKEKDEEFLSVGEKKSQETLNKEKREASMIDNSKAELHRQMEGYQKMKMPSVEQVKNLISQWTDKDLAAAFDSTNMDLDKEIEKAKGKLGFSSMLRGREVNQRIKDMVAFSDKDNKAALIAEMEKRGLSTKVKKSVDEVIWYNHW